MEEVERKERREEMRIRLQGGGVGMSGRSTPWRDLRGEGSQTDQNDTPHLLSGCCLLSATVSNGCEG